MVLTSVYDSYEKGHVTRLKAREIMKVENNENEYFVTIIFLIFFYSV